MFHGKLTQENGASFILDENGVHHFENRVIWDGYLNHWKGQNVFARELTQRDYDKGEPIIIIWPDELNPDKPFIDLYYNARLIKYVA